MAADSSSEPPQPSRFEKKRNTPLRYPRWGNQIRRIALACPALMRSSTFSAAAARAAQ